MHLHKILIGLVISLLLLSCGNPDSALVVLHRGNGTEPDTLDPQKSSGQWESFIIGDMIIGLTTEGPDGKAVAGAAESWTSSPDGLLWTFNIRKDMNWSDGVPVTAGDFVYAFQRILNPKTAAQYASLIYGIKNAEAVNTGKLPPDAVGARAVDDKTLEITLEHPVPFFLQLARHQTMAPVPKHVVEKFGDQWVKAENMVVNGPYKLTEWVPNSHVKLVKNKDFYDSKNVQIDEVVFYPLNDPSVEMKRFETGTFDITSSIPARQLADAKKKFGAQVHVHPVMAVGYAQVNTQRAMFKDARVRRALALAIDRETICYKILNAGQVPAYSFVPPDVANYPDRPQFDFKTKSQEARQAEARELLKAAGFGPGHPLKFTYRYMDSPDAKRVAVAMQDMWKAVGIEADLLNTEAKVHYDALRTQDFDVASAGWVADYDDAQNFLYLLQSSSGAMNYSKYENAKFDELMASAAVTTDLAVRATQLAEAERLILADAPLIPINFGAFRVLVSSKVKGWIDNPGEWNRTRYLRVER